MNKLNIFNPKINGVRVKAVLDTGATLTLFSPSVINKLHIKLKPCTCSPSVQIADSVVVKITQCAEVDVEHNGCFTTLQFIRLKNYSLIFYWD